MITMKLHPRWRDHVGHCQVTYTSRNQKNERLVYCLQEHWPNQVRAMRCSQDGEPSHEVTFSKPVHWEKTPGESRLENVINKWIDKQPVVIRCDWCGAYQADCKSDNAKPLCDECALLEQEHKESW